MTLYTLVILFSRMYDGDMDESHLYAIEALEELHGFAPEGVDAQGNVPK